MADVSPSAAASGEEEGAIDDGTSQLETPDESVANDWTKEETSVSAIPLFVAQFQNSPVHRLLSSLSPRTVSLLGRS